MEDNYLLTQDARELITVLIDQFRHNIINVLTSRIAQSQYVITTICQKRKKWVRSSPMPLNP